MNALELRTTHLCSRCYTGFDLGDRSALLQMMANWVTQKSKSLKVGNDHQVTPKCCEFAIERDVAEYGGRIGRLGSYPMICRYVSHWNFCTVQYRILHLACALSRMCTAVDVNCTGIRRVHLLRGWPNKSTFT